MHLNSDNSFSPETIKEIEAELYKLTEEYSIETFPSEHRNHLGVSIIGEKCWRKLWYSFRWVKLEQFPPRIRRLFNRGHREEKEFIKLLLWMGFFIREIDEATNKQYKFNAVNGHYGGSSDSLALLPWFRENIHPKILIEYKTHNNKQFTYLKDKKLKIAQPKHFAQICGYGKEFKTRYGLYCAVNKDNDELYFEFIELDWQYAEQLEKKASDIIYSKFPPDRIASDPNYFECVYCSFRDICHNSAKIEQNCRSCQFSTPIENEQWQCNQHNTIIPKDQIGKKWPCHVAIA